MIQQHQKLLQDFVGALDQEKIPYEHVYLYGSAARGAKHEWSDIDVAVVGPSFEKDRIEETVKLRMAAHEIDATISPVPLRPEDLDDMFSTIGQAVKKEGQKIK